MSALSDNLAAALDLHAKGRPTHPAIVSGPEDLDHRAFANRVRGLAAALAARGTGAGAFVGVALKDTAWHCAAIFALARLGAVMVPIDWRWTQAEAESLAGHFGVTQVLMEPDAPPFAGVEELRLAPALAAEADAPTSAAEVPLASGGDRPVILSLSSGTTGRPTGPLATHAMMRARIENQLAALTFNQHDRHLLPTPLYFGGGRAFAISHLFIGATLILHPPPYEPADLAQAVETHRADTTFLVPTLIRRLLQLPDAALAPMRRLRVLVSSGAPLHPPEREAVATRLTPGFMEYFASTEGGGVAILPPGAWRGHPNSVGRAALGVEVEVVGEDRRPLPPGEEGLVRYRGASVATSFFNDPEKSAEAFRDGWFHPGDVGRLDAEGYLTLLGRASQKIIRGGVNLHPAEIERALEGLPEIEEAAVFGIPHPELGEEVRAVVVAGADTDAARVRAALGGRLAPYKIPRDIVFAEALPRNAAGKVALREVKARWGDVEASAQP